MWSHGYRFYQMYQDAETRKIPLPLVIALRPDEDCKVRDGTGKFTRENQWNAWIPEGDSWKYDDVRESYLRTHCRVIGANKVEEQFPALVRFLKKQLRVSEFVDELLTYDKEQKEREKRWK